MSFAFEIERPYVDRFETHRVGGKGIDELWVPAGEPGEFNRHIVGAIEVTVEYR